MSGVIPLLPGVQGHWHSRAQEESACVTEYKYVLALRYEGHTGANMKFISAECT
jgi:hypothetical protein